VLLAAIVGATTLLAVSGAPAGAASSKPTAKEWAGSVCTAFVTFGDSVQKTLEGLKSAGSVEDAATSAKQGIQDATQQLQSSLDAAGKPPTSNGSKAQSTIQNLGKQLSADADAIQQALTPAPSSPGDVASAFATIGSEVQHAVSQTKSAVSTLSGLKGNSALRKGFQSAPSCQQLKSDL
jgi:hypothetical protein